MMRRRRRKKKKKKKKKKTSDRKSLLSSILDFLAFVFSICTLFGLLEARDTRFCILMTYLPIDKRSVLLVSSLSPGQNREDMAFQSHDDFGMHLCVSRMLDASHQGLQGSLHAY